MKRLALAFLLVLSSAALAQPTTEKLKFREHNNTSPQAGQFWMWQDTLRYRTAAGVTIPISHFVPVGGTTGKVLKKLSATNFDLEWGSDNTGGGGGGAALSNVPYNQATWDGDSDSGATRNALRDKFEALDAAKQNADADLNTWATLTPSANAQSLVTAANYSAMRTLLTLVPGTDIQAFSAALAIYSAISPSANVQSLLSAADYAAIRTLLGLVIGTNVQAFDADLNTIAALTATTDNFMVSVASAWASRTPAQVKVTLSLNNVENTALSTWNGTTNVTTLGTIGTGVWNATAIGATKGGTGLTAADVGDLIFGSGVDAWSRRAIGTAGQFLWVTGGVPDWRTLVATDISDGPVNYADSGEVLVQFRVKGEGGATRDTIIGVQFVDIVHIFNDESKLLNILASETPSDGQVPKWHSGGVTWDDDNAGGVSDGDKGDVTVSSSGTVWTIDNGVVTLAKMATMATASLLGRNTAGTGAVEVLSASTARTLLGLVIGTNVQAYDSDLDYLATFTPAANIKSILNAADYAAVRTLLGLVIGTNVQAYDADLDYLATFTPTANVKSILNAADYAAIRALLDLEAGTDFLGFPTGTPTGSKFLRDDNSWQTIAGGGDALTANPLSQFAATTSAQFFGVISDETGGSSGVVVGSNSPIFTDDITLAAAGVGLLGADGVFTITGLGNGNDENLSFDFDNGTANQVDVSSSTGVTQINFNSINVTAPNIFTSSDAATNRIGWLSSATNVAHTAGFEFNGTVFTFPSPFTLGATSVTTTGAQLNYLNTASGVTGSGNLALATSGVFVTPNLGTPSALTLTNATGLPIAGLVASTSTAIGVGSVELGHASANTLTGSGGVLSVEGVAVPTISSTNTLTNKRWTARVGSTTSSATPTINTDNVDIYKLTAQAADITSMTTNLSGTPVDGDILEIQITGTAARAITWGASFVSSTVTLPATTVTTATLTVVLQYFTTSSYGANKWVCVNSF